MCNSPPIHGPTHLTWRRWASVTPQRCRRAVEGLSASPMAEMLLRAQAARRALSALADEIASRAGSCGERANPTSLDDGGIGGVGGGGASHLSGHRSDAISKLAQSRAGALSFSRGAPCAPSPSAPSPLSVLPAKSCADLAPPSPLAEITNTGGLRGLSVGASVRGMLASLESGSMSPGVSIGGEPTEISRRLEERIQIKQAPVRWGPVTAAVAGMKTADTYPCWKDASVRPAAHMISFKNEQANTKAGRVLNNDNSENMNPSVLLAGISSSSNSQGVIHAMKDVSKEKGHGNQSSPIRNERRILSVALNQIHHDISCQRMSQPALSTKKRALNIDAAMQCRLDGLNPGEMTTEAARYNPLQNGLNIVGEVERVESKRCLNDQSKCKTIDLQSHESRTKSHKLSQNELNSVASEKQMPFVYGATESCRTEVGDSRPRNKSNSLSAKQFKSRLGMLIKIQVSGIKGMSNTNLEVLSISLSAENPSPLWRLSRPARSLSSKTNEPLWEDVLGILDDSALEFRFLLKSDMEPWWKLSVSCASLCCFSNTEQQSLHLELKLVSTSHCMQQNECSISLVVHFKGPISSPCQSVLPTGPISYTASVDPSEDSELDKVLPSGTAVNVNSRLNTGKSIHPEHEITSICSVLDDVWDAGMALVQGTDGIFEVSSLVSGSPADREGIAEGDLVFEAASKELRGLQRNEVNNILKGPLGSTIHCVVWRYGHNAPCRISLIREVSSNLGIDATESIDKHLDKGYVLEKAESSVATCTPTPSHSSQEPGKSWRITFLEPNPGPNLVQESQCINFASSPKDVGKETLHANLNDDPQLGSNMKEEPCCATCPQEQMKCCGPSHFRGCTQTSYSRDDVSDASAEEEDWILTWSVEEVCDFFRNLRLDGEGIAEAAERAALVKSHLIDGTILTGTLNDFNGDCWLARTLALAPNKVVELREHLNEARILHQNQNKDPASHIDFSTNPRCSGVETNSRAGVFQSGTIYEFLSSVDKDGLFVPLAGSSVQAQPFQDHSVNSNVNIHCEKFRNQPNTDLCDGLTGMGADIHRRRVREWTPDDVLAFLRDLVPYSSAKDTEFRNGNIRRYNVSGKELLDNYLEDDNFWQHKLLLMPAQAARARGILRSYWRPVPEKIAQKGGLCQLRCRMSSLQHAETHMLAREMEDVHPPNRKNVNLSKHKTSKQGPESDDADVKSIISLSGSETCIKSNDSGSGQQIKIRSSVTPPPNVGQSLECQDAELWYSEALACRLKCGNKETQMDLLQKALERNPHHVNSLCDCGVLMQDAFKNFDAAETYYRRALSSDPNHVTCLCNYAILLAQELNYPAKAKELYERALLIDASNIHAMHSLASLLSDYSGDYQAAQKLYDRVLQFNPNYVPTLCNYGALLDSVFGDYDGSNTLYQRALSVCPDHTLTLCNFGALLNDIYKDYSGSESLFCRGLQSNPNHVATLCNYGWLQMDGLHNPLAAWVLFEKALELEPCHAQTLFNYACLLEKCSIFDCAEIKYKAALQSNPRLVSCRRQYASFLLSVRNNPEAASAVLKEMGVVRGIL